MKVKTSITLSQSILDQIDDRIGEEVSRSAFIEDALARHLAELARHERDERDIEIINRNAERLNREALEVLEHQVIP